MFFGLVMCWGTTVSASENEVFGSISQGKIKAVNQYLEAHPEVFETSPDDPDGTWGRALARTRDVFRLHMQDGQDIFLDEDPDEIASWKEFMRAYLGIYDLLLQPMKSAVQREQLQADVYRSAILDGNSEVVRVVVDHGYPVQVRDATGATPLLIAAGEGQVETVQLLLSKKAGLNQAGILETPLIRAASRNRLEMAQFLLQQGADVNFRIHEGETVLYAVVRESNSKMLALLLKFGIKVNLPTRFGWTALMEAASHRKSEMVKALLKQGADPSLRDAQGRTALMAAAQSRCTQCAALLIPAGGDVNAADAEGKTALMVAVSQPNNKNLIALLVQAGADSQQSTANGDSALTLAQGRGWQEYVELLNSPVKLN